MPPRTPISRPLAPHVQAAIDRCARARGTTQAKGLAPGLPTLAPHVLQAMARHQPARSQIARSQVARPQVAPSQTAPGVARQPAPHVLTAIGQPPTARTPVQARPAPRAVQLAALPERKRRNPQKAREVSAGLTTVLTRFPAVGREDADWVVKTSGEKKTGSSQSCDATVQTGAGSFAGSYNSSTAIHAEMAALASFVSTGSGRFADIQTIRITSPTCPRCAYVLTSLGLGDTVRYPKGTSLGNRMGPGWKMPEALKKEAWYMEPLEAVLDELEPAGYSRDEGFAEVVVEALESV